MTALPDALRLALGWGLIALGVALPTYLWIAHVRKNRLRRRTGQPTRTAVQHLTRHAPHHIVAGVWLLVGLALLLAGGGAAILLHRGGATLVPGRHIPAPRHHRAGGPVPDSYASADLAAYTRPDDTVNQGGTLACCAITTVRLDALNRAISRGEYATPLYPISGYRAWWYATNGQLGTTDPIDDMAALNSHGGEPLYYWGPGGYPDSTDPFYVIPMGNGSLVWQTYIDSGMGRAGLDDLEWRLDRRQPVGLLWAVHYDGDHAQGQAYTWDGGPFAYYHCLVAIQWAKDYPGLGEAVRVWNSFGSSYGQGGYIWLPAAVVMSHGIGTFTETPGAAVASWLPAPTPTATVRPRPTATPRPATPGPCVPHVGVLATDANLHATPVLGSPAVAGEREGARLSTVCPGPPDSTHWTYRIDTSQRQGWLLKSALK